MEKTLYIRDVKGQVRYWTCRTDIFGLEIEHGVLGGTPQFQSEDIDEGKAGRDIDEQIESRFESRVNKQLDKGYVEDIEIAKTMKPVNRLGFCKPMLAQKYADVNLMTLAKGRVFFQNKLDGNRCLVHNDGEKIVAYTRNGKLFNTLDHILEGLEIPVGCTLDGELYIHGESLQTIVSLVKRKQPRTSEVEYHVYDMISDEPFSARYTALKEVLASNPNERIRLVETTEISSENSNLRVLESLSTARKLGYEGLMIRSDLTYVRNDLKLCGYEDGKRSKSLIKCKVWLDEEFEVVDINPSADGWAILACKCKGGEFTVTCPGTVQFKHQVMRTKEKYIGKKVTVEFAYWTDEDKPFHPVAKIFRDYD